MGLGLGVGSSWFGVALGRTCLSGLCSRSPFSLGLGLGSWSWVLARLGWVWLLVALVPLGSWS